ncbi:MAG TPA: alpha/beta hydrolase [Gammaproteobacteria bacterium]|nr:alpha/beta hydrolase [Gammaproteobacteria bacterium]
MPVALAFSLCTASRADDIDVENPPGQMVDVGGYRLHIDCRGEGSPTVVMDAGLGGVSLEWLPVQQPLSRHGRVCSYDRAGNGWSDPGPQPRTAAVIVEELHTLLSNAGVPGPYVLVGHSFGGYTAQLFAERYPKLTAGIVLIDSSHPAQVARFLAPPLRMNTAPGKDVAGIVLAGGVPLPPAHMPAELRLPTLMLMSQHKALVTAAQEFLYFRDSGEEVRKSGRLPPVPLVVITRGIAERSAKDPRAPMIESLWLQLQDELAARSPRAVHLIATQSGHHIHLDQPGLVAGAIGMVRDLARRQAMLSLGLALAVTDTSLPAITGVTWRSDTLHTAPDGFSLANLRGLLAERRSQSANAGPWLGVEHPHAVAMQPVSYDGMY